MCLGARQIQVRNRQAKSQVRCRPGSTGGLRCVVSWVWTAQSLISHLLLGAASQWDHQSHWIPGNLKVHPQYINT